MSLSIIEKLELLKYHQGVVASCGSGHMNIEQKESKKIADKLKSQIYSIKL